MKHEHLLKVLEAVGAELVDQSVIDAEIDLSCMEVLSEDDDSADLQVTLRTLPYDDLDNGVRIESFECCIYVRFDHETYETAFLCGPDMDDEISLSTVHILQAVLHSAVWDISAMKNGEDI